MDLSVKKALIKWPNVPAVYGWLSLDERGRWHIHEQGDAVTGGAGEPISSPQILAFIGRNYEADDSGRWFFQNGPQRVYVRLDAAPFILRVADNGRGLTMQTGQSVTRIDGWWLNETGRLYAQTDLGGGLVDGRDLEAVLNALSTHPDGTPLIDAIEKLEVGESAAAPSADGELSTMNDATAVMRVIHADYPTPVPLHRQVTEASIQNALGFVANPSPKSPD